MKDAQNLYRYFSKDKITKIIINENLDSIEVSLKTGFNKNETFKIKTLVVTDETKGTIINKKIKVLINENPVYVYEKDLYYTLLLFKDVYYKEPYEMFLTLNKIVE